MSGVLILSHEQVGLRMAGPAIRCWEMARALSPWFAVTLAAPGPAGLEPDGFELAPYNLDAPPSWAELVEATGGEPAAVIASGALVHRLPALHDLPVPLVADVYIPEAVEALAWHAASRPDVQRAVQRHAVRVTHDVARYADWLICAGERQRDYWLGVMAAAGRLCPDLYAEDPDLRNLVEVVPFGCPSEPPPAGPALKGVWPGIGPHDRLILWGGGVWNWLDPITLLRAMPKVLAHHPTARLVFLGADHPDANRVPEMEVARRAREVSRELGLEGSAVFWGPWVPYADRGAYLLEADVAVSLHGAGVEPRLAFRTRLLDAMWAGLPAVVTRGDQLAAELEAHGLAYGVEAGDVDGVAQALSALLDEPDARAVRREAFERLRERYRWERVVEPLREFCRAPRLGAGKAEAWALEAPRDAGREAALRAEVERLQKLVQGYESGRMMRAMAALHRLRRRLGIAAAPGTRPDSQRGEAE